VWSTTALREGRFAHDGKKARLSSPDPKQSNNSSRGMNARGEGKTSERLGGGEGTENVERVSCIKRRAPVSKCENKLDKRYVGSDG